MSRSAFNQANLAGANMSKSELNRSDFTQADLTGADLSRAELARVVFTRAQSRRGQFQLFQPVTRQSGRSRSGRVDLTGSYLFLTQLGGANLAGAKGLTQAQLDMACGDASHQTASGLTAPKSWPCAAELE